MPTPSPHMSRPGACSFAGSEWKPPLGIVFAPHVDALAALEQRADLRMRLQLLQQVVDGELDVAVVEPDDHADREHVVAHRVDERAAELAVLRRGAQRPAHRVDDAVERLRRPSRPPSRRAPTPAGSSPRSPKWSSATPVRWPCVPSASTVTFATMSEPGSKFAERLALASASLVAGADADDAAVRDEQLLRRRLGQDHRAALLRALGQPAAELRERERCSCRGCASSAAAGCGSALRRVRT